MIKVSEKLASKTVTLICFGEYVGFIHFGEHDHCRIESEAVVVGDDGRERALFPSPTEGVLLMILGAKVREVVFENTFDIILDNGVVIKSLLQDGYESVMLNVDGQSEFY